MESFADDFEFTYCAENEFYELIEKEDFSHKDQDYIYDCLMNRLSFINFGDHLKRYIYRSIYGNDDTSAHTVDYRSHLISMFEMNGVPSSLNGAGGTKLSAAAGNWLSQKYVTRETVFLLGFGLGMTAGEVSEMLVCASGDADFDFKDPYEVIYWFCYRNFLGYSDMRMLVNEYERIKENFAPDADISADSTSDTLEFKNKALRITNKDELLGFAANLNPCNMSDRTVFKTFTELYDKACDILAKLGKKPSAGELERQIYIGIMRNEQGNLMPVSKSGLGALFEGKRLSRKRLNDMLNQKMTPGRFDIITLNFFIHAYDHFFDDTEKNVKQDYYKFIDETNSLLKKCSMNGLYSANPYENFIAMCMMTSDPMMTFAEIWSRSYGEK